MSDPKSDNGDNRTGGPLRGQVIFRSKDPDISGMDIEFWSKTLAVLLFQFHELKCLKGTEEDKKVALASACAKLAQFSNSMKSYYDQYTKTIVEGDVGSYMAAAKSAAGVHELCEMHVDGLYAAAMKELN